MLLSSEDDVYLFAVADYSFTPKFSLIAKAGVGEMDVGVAYHLSQHTALTLDARYTLGVSPSNDPTADQTPSLIGLVGINYTFGDLNAKHSYFGMQAGL